ncbi:MAG: hypothetical protein IT359_14100 [Gemmatimonadaceae bacterium]|nr:hypothetical protein [Gemmatimonadaceae bacterium]
MCGFLGVMPCAGHAQGARRLEISAVGGAAHTSRLGRLSAEQWLEPFAGARLDARLWRLAGGRVGVSAFADYYSFGRSWMAPVICMGVCPASPARPRQEPLIPYTSTGQELRLALGTTWQRPISRWVSAELGAFAGRRRARSFLEAEGVRLNDPPSSFRALIGGEVGLSTQRGPLVSGIGFQFASSVLEGGVRRSQNRVAMRLGWALP